MDLTLVLNYTNMRKENVDAINTHQSIISRLNIQLVTNNYFIFKLYGFN